MPGSINNDQVTEALNQVIQAINDLVLELGPGEGVTVSVDLAPLVAAVEALDFCCPPPPPISIIGPDGGGTEPPIPDDWVITDPPPEGWQVVENPTDDRRCKAANYNHDALKHVIEELEAKGVANFGRLFIGLIITLLFRIGILAGIFSPLIARVLQTFGYTKAISEAVIEGGIGHSYSSLVNALDANREALVCALFEATGLTQGRADYLQVLIDDNVATEDLAIVGAVLSWDFIANLWIQRSAVEEASLAAYNPTIVSCCTLSGWLTRQGSFSGGQHWGWVWNLISGDGEEFNDGFGWYARSFIASVYTIEYAIDIFGDRHFEVTINVDSLSGPGVLSDVSISLEYYNGVVWTELVGRDIASFVNDTIEFDGTIVGEAVRLRVDSTNDYRVFFVSFEVS